MIIHFNLGQLLFDKFLALQIIGFRLTWPPNHLDRVLTHTIQLNFLAIFRPSDRQLSIMPFVFFALLLEKANQPTNCLHESRKLFMNFGGV